MLSYDVFSLNLKENIFVNQYKLFFLQIYFSCLRWISPGDEYDFTSNQAIAILNKNKLSFPCQKCLAIWNVMKMRMIGWMTPGDGLPHRTLHQSPIHSLNILGFFYSSCQCRVSSRMWKVNFSFLHCFRFAIGNWTSLINSCKCSDESYDRTEPSRRVLSLSW